MFLELGTVGHRMTLYSTILLTVLLPFVISKFRHKLIRFSIGLFLHSLFASFFSTISIWVEKFIFLTVLLLVDL